MLWPGGTCLEREDHPSEVQIANEIIDQSSSSAADRHRRHQNLDEGPSGPGTAAANDFVDDVLKNLPKFSAHINPARLSDFQRRDFRLTNVTLAGISDAYRYYIII